MPGDFIATGIQAVDRRCAQLQNEIDIAGDRAAGDNLGNALQIGDEVEGGVRFNRSSK